MYDFKRHVGGDTDILDRGSIPLSSIMGLPRLRQGVMGCDWNLLG